MPQPGFKRVVVLAPLLCCAFAVAVGSVVGGVPAGAAAPDQVTSPVAAQDSIELFELHPELRIELAAAEPQVIDPIEVRFDERGRMWVVEMHDYPNGPAEGERGTSLVKMLEDRDGDGYFETATTLIEDLLFATGLQPWQGGAIVTLAGEVIYAKDTTGDGRADVKETWFTGFPEDNPQLGANHPRLGLDNHVYIANGLRGGTIKRPDQADDEAVSISGMDFRFDPHTKEFTAVTGNGQFGLALDEFGNRFICSNRHPLDHVVLEDAAVRRNPLAAISTSMQVVATHGEGSRVFPIATSWTTSNLHAGQFTAACGIQIITGNALPAEFYGNSLTCDPTAHIVHREVLEPTGPTFTSHPAREGVEMLASRDAWFSPVNTEIGPNGALYVVDMYRAVIEHPEWVPDELKERADLRYGDDRGRIYRVVARGHEPTNEVNDLGEKTSAELVAVLDEPNSWRRATAARLLLERQHRDVQAALEQLVRTGTHSQARLRALWLLHGLQILDSAIVAVGLDDADPRVRRQALQLSDMTFNPADKSEPAPSAWVQLAHDPDSGVRFQAALNLARVGDPTNASALSYIALEGGGDSWSIRAVRLGAGERADLVLKETLSDLEANRSGFNSGVAADLLYQLAEQAGKNNAIERLGPVFSEVLAMNDEPSAIDWQLGTLRGLAAGLSRHGQGLTEYVDGLGDPATSKQLQHLFAGARSVVTASQVDSATLGQSLRFLAHDPQAVPTLLALATEADVPKTRRQAIGVLASSAQNETWAILLDSLPDQLPSARGAIIAGTISRTERVTLLLDRIEGEEILAAEISRAHADALRKHDNDQIRERVQALLGDPIAADRQQVLADYQSVLQLEADPHKGRAVFAKHCATCHRFGEQGVNVGPDISDTRSKSTEYLLTAIVQPNQAIDANFFGYSVITTDGRVLSGILASETANAITLRQPEGRNVTIGRDEIDELRSSGLSLMPVGLERDIPQQAMADLISFLQNWRYLDGSIPIPIGGD